MINKFIFTTFITAIIFIPFLAGCSQSSVTDESKQQDFVKVYLNQPKDAAVELAITAILELKPGQYTPVEIVNLVKTNISDAGKSAYPSIASLLDSSDKIKNLLGVILYDKTVGIDEYIMSYAAQIHTMPARVYIGHELLNSFRFEEYEKYLGVVTQNLGDSDVALIANSLVNPTGTMQFWNLCVESTVESSLFQNAHRYSHIFAYELFHRSSQIRNSINLKLDAGEQIASNDGIHYFDTGVDISAINSHLQDIIKHTSGSVNDIFLNQTQSIAQAFNEPQKFANIDPGIFGYMGYRLATREHLLKISTALKEYIDMGYYDGSLLMQYSQVKYALWILENHPDRNKI